MNEQNELDLDQMMELVREEDRANAEVALQRYRAERPQILRQVLDGLEAEAQGEHPGPLAEPSLVPVWVASDRSDLDEIRERIGAAFQERGPIPLEFYSGELYVLDRESALFRFGKGGQSTAELNGSTIEFYLLENPSNCFSETIDDGEVVIDFGNLGLSIEAYAAVGFKIQLDASTVIEGKLGDE